MSSDGTSVVSTAHKDQQIYFFSLLAFSCVLAISKFTLLFPVLFDAAALLAYLDQMVLQKVPAVLFYQQSRDLMTGLIPDRWTPSNFFLTTKNYKSPFSTKSASNKAIEAWEPHSPTTLLEYQITWTPLATYALLVPSPEVMLWKPCKQMVTLGYETKCHIHHLLTFHPSLLVIVASSHPWVVVAMEIVTTTLAVSLFSLVDKNCLVDEEMWEPRMQMDKELNP